MFERERAYATTTECETCKTCKTCKYCNNKVEIILF